MPSSAPTPCRSPMCPNMATNRGRCADHQGEVRTAARQYSRHRREAGKVDKFYDSAAWRAVRRTHLQREPLCRMCAADDVITPAKLVDHLVERKDGGADFDRNNLQSLCHTCHQQKTYAVRRQRQLDVQ